MHIPKGFANYLLVGSTSKKKTDAGEFAIEEGYAIPENLFSRIVKTIQSPDIDKVHKAVKNKNQHAQNTTHDTLKLKYPPISCQHSIKYNPSPTFTESSFNLICLLE